MRYLQQLVAAGKQSWVAVAIGEIQLHTSNYIIPTEEIRISEDNDFSLAHETNSKIKIFSKKTESNSNTMANILLGWRHRHIITLNWGNGSKTATEMRGRLQSWPVSLAG